MSFFTCDNSACGKTRPVADAVWIANIYTVCCESCKKQFLADNPHIIEQHLKILGLDIPNTREALLSLATMVL